jgi:hypothetical protein
VKTASNTNMGFGDFDIICRKAAVPLCTLVGPANSISGSAGIMPTCYARSIELANTIIFQGAADFMHIIALGMTAIMILHVRSKFTAVGMIGNWFLNIGRPWLIISINRPKGNHNLLLHLHGPNHLLPRP